MYQGVTEIIDVTHFAQTVRISTAKQVFSNLEPSILELLYLDTVCMYVFLESIIDFAHLVFQAPVFDAFIWVKNRLLYIRTTLELTFGSKYHSCLAVWLPNYVLHCQIVHSQTPITPQRLLLRSYTNAGYTAVLRKHKEIKQGSHPLLIIR